MERREGIPDMYIYDCSVNKCGLKKNTKNCLYCVLAEGNEKKKSCAIFKQSIHSSSKI